MSDVTRILNAIERGDAGATDKLLPLVYEELRKLAAAKLALEKPGVAAGKIANLGEDQSDGAFRHGARQPARPALVSPRVLSAARFLSLTISAEDCSRRITRRPS